MNAASGPISNVDTEKANDSDDKITKSINFKSSNADFFAKQMPNLDKPKLRSLSQLAPENVPKTQIHRMLNSSMLLKTPVYKHPTPRSLNDVFNYANSKTKIKVEYINIVADANLIPKYLSGTVKFETTKRDDCNRSFDKIVQSSDRIKPVLSPRKFHSFNRKSKHTDNQYNFEKINSEKTLNYYPERNKEKSIIRPLTNSPSGDFYFDSELKNRKSLNENNINDEDDENDYAKLNRINELNEEYTKSLNLHRHNNYDSLKLKREKTLDYNFKIQRTNSSYETFNAIKKRVQFLEKIDINELKEIPESDYEEQIKKPDVKIAEFYDYSTKLCRSNSFLENEKKKKNSKTKEKERDTDKNKRIVIKDEKKSELNNDSPLLESYKEIVNKSIEENKKQIEKKNITKEKNNKYYHILDKLLDIEKEKKKKKIANKLNKYQANLKLSIENEEENYDPNLNNSENWLIKWSIIKSDVPTNLVEIFKLNDVLKRGYLNEDLLKKAISMACTMTNLRRSYLYNVLSLCGIDSANLKVFNIIISLALKINHLDDDWFFNLLPKFDLVSIENKVYKALTLWKYLVISYFKAIKRLNKFRFKKICLRITA